MAVIVPTRRDTPRLGLGAGLVAAARGLAFTGLMLAGLGLLLVILAAVLLTALGVAMLIIGNGNPAFRVVVALLLGVPGLGIGLFLAPGAATACWPARCWGPPGMPGWSSGSGS